MSIIDILTSLFKTHDIHEFNYYDPISNENNSIEITNEDLYDHLNFTPNLHPEHFEEVLNHNDVAMIKPHMEGVLGNLITKKYFSSLGANVDYEVPIDDNHVDLLVKPYEQVTLKKLSLNDDHIEIKDENVDENFAVEVKNYSETSLNNFFNSDSISEQIQNGKFLANKSYLAVTEDFLNLDFYTQKELINMAETHGDGLIILPYSNYEIDQFLNELLSKIQ